MIKKLLAIGLFLYGLFVCAQAQEITDNKELGLYFDINGKPINNYCDFDYLPEDALRIYYETDGEYVPGAYYDLTGKKVNCDIKQSATSTEVYFKTAGLEEVLLNPDNCSGYVVGLDSFIVISNFQINKTFGKPIIKERDWAQVITKAKDYTLLKNSRQKGISTDFITTYIIKTDSSSHLTGVFNDKTVIQFFGDFTVIKEEIAKMRLSYLKITTIAKHYEYKDKYEKNEKIYFSQSWDELKGPANATYYAKITDLTGLVFELKFFDNANTPLYTGHFSSFAPIIKHGEFTWFYSDGIVRKRANYKDDKIDGSVTEYFNNGKIHTVCKVNSNKYKYLRVADKGGKDMLDAKGNGAEVIQDSLNNREITRWYISNGLLYSTYVDISNNRIFQYCDNNTTISSFKSFQGRMKKDVKFPLETFKRYKHGLVLIKFLVDSTGNTVSYKIVKGLGELFDKQLLSFLGSGNSKLKWKVPIHKEKPCFQEIVVPVLFEIKTIKRNNIRYNMYDSFFWMQQQQMMTRPDMNQMQRMAR